LWNYKICGEDKWEPKTNFIFHIHYPSFSLHFHFTFGLLVYYHWFSMDQSTSKWQCCSSYYLEKCHVLLCQHVRIIIIMITHTKYNMNVPWMVHEYTINGKWKWLFTCNENTNPSPTFPHNKNAKINTMHKTYKTCMQH